MLEYANVDSPSVGVAWKEMEGSTRLSRVRNALSDNDRFGALIPTEAREDGQVYLKLESPLRASERGVLLRAVEAHLKDVLDQGITVWCEPLGDKNSLRKLRGIQVLS